MPPIVRGSISPLLAPDLRQVYFDTGKERPREYTYIANVTDMEWNPMKDLQVAGIGVMPAKNESDRFSLDQHILGGTKSYLASPYGLALEFSWESWRDELYGIARELTAEMARSGRYREEVSFWSVLNNAFSTSFAGFTASESLCSTTHVGLDGVTRKNRPTVDIGLSITGLQGMIGRFETMTDERGLPRLMAPSMIVIDPSNKFVAREILGSSGKPYTTDNEINALIEEDLAWMVCHYLTTATYWFGVASKGIHDLNFMWRDHPIFDAFDDPWTKSAVFTGYQRHTLGQFGAWRGVDGSTG